MGAPPTATGEIADDVGALPDELNVFLAGRYYGHPNPARSQFAFREDLADGTPHQAALTLFNTTSVVTGIDEYGSSANGGQLQGALLCTGFADGRLRYVTLSADGLVATKHGILMQGFENPLDLTVGPDGTIYVLEAGGTLLFGGVGPARIIALIPDQPSQ